MVLSAARSNPECANHQSWARRSLGHQRSILLAMFMLSAVSVISSAVELAPDQRVDQPRQYFKIYSPPRSSGLAKVQSFKHQGANNSNNNKRRAITNDKDSQPKLNKQKSSISNATLKKLLSQSLLNKSNKLNDTNNVSKSNFKFVFIQRAAVSPSNSSGSSVEYSKKTGTVKPQPSLAASVSKQLASSLLNSASSLVDTGVVAGASGAPSITALASQIVSRTIDPNGNTTSPSTTRSTSTTTTTTTEKSLIDGRLQSESSEGKEGANKISATKVADGKAYGSKRNKSRPSKVYNLPVKFVANGQPTHLVFNTIRQHFATIKKLQASTTGGYKAAADSRRRKPGQGKLNKGSSRLIYLPLRYLSNAKPNRIISSKIRH